MFAVQNLKMAAAKWRRPDRKVPGCQNPRMYLCWVVLISLAMVMGQTRQKMQVRYDSGAKKLHIECPPAEGGTLMATYLYRDKSTGQKMLAEWIKDRQTVPNHHERIEVHTSPDQAQMMATLSHVTCFDSAIYRCKNMIQPEGEPLYLNYTDIFRYRGEVTKPYLTAPVRTRYSSGDQLQLNCSASVGGEDNDIAWFIRRASDSEKSPLQTHTSQEESMDTDCSLRKSSQLLYTVGPEDDGAIFECRLNSTGHHSEIIIALHCPEDVHGIRPDDHSGTDAPIVPTDALGYLDTPRAAESRGLEGSHNTAAEGEDSSSSGSVQGTDNLTLMIVVCSLVVILGVTAGGMFLLMRRWRNRQMPALVLVGHSEYGYNPTTSSSSSSTSSSSSSSRQLPHLPNLSSMLDRHNNTTNTHSRHPRHPYPHPRRHGHQRHHSFPDDFSDPSLGSLAVGRSMCSSRYVDSPLSSAAHYKGKEDPNLSVYVTMTNLDYLHATAESPFTTPVGKKDPGAPGAGFADPPAPHSLAGGGGGGPTSMGSEYDNMNPGMREERSESIYSNEGWSYSRGVKRGGNGGGGGGGGGGNNGGRNNAIIHHSDAAAVAADDADVDEVTRLKIVD